MAGIGSCDPEARYEWTRATPRQAAEVDELRTPSAVGSILTAASAHIMMPTMRTTLTIDADVELLLQREIRRTNRSMKAVVNDALRVGLGIRGKPARPPRFKVEPHAFGFRPGVDVDRLNQLVDELEASEVARRLDR
ncbi:MAG: hypothetical protein OXF33_01955 [Rhodospirillales bacterium]|nr:hypothetical protein [Rhodospirillales bacterium]